MNDTAAACALGPRFEEALAYATQVHAGQVRKGTSTPYVSHLLAVASLVLEHGGDEDQAIAALLHDALEDQPDRTDAAELERRFGARVRRIVEACSDTTVHPKPPWKGRKERYLEHLGDATADVLLVSCADKVHNLRAILADHAEHGDAMFERFNETDPQQHLWYYGALAAAFAERLPGRLSSQLSAMVEEFRTAVSTPAG